MKVAFRLFPWVVSLGLVLFLAPVTQAQPVKVRAVYPSVDVQYLPAYLGQTNGFFKEEALEVELIVMRGARSGVQALLGGDVHFGLALGATFSLFGAAGTLKSWPR